MRNFNEANLTDAVLAKLAGAPNPRFTQITSSLLRHMHDFVREVELTEEEWFTGIQFLTATGQKCDDKRQEFILLSDTLGVSMLVDALNHRQPVGATESTVLGPFYVDGAPEFPNGTDLAKGFPGDPTLFSGHVLTTGGQPIANAQVDTWQADTEGFYDVQRPNPDEMRLRGKFRTDTQGKFWFWTVRPTEYPVPTDGPVGQMLLQMGRHPYRPAHIHTVVSAPGYETVTTHVFVEGDRYLDSDAVFGVKDSLVVDFIRHDPGPAPDGTRMNRPYFTVNYDFGLSDKK
ncbi:MAG: intradiol ring-cleavage dioxygenase [Deltaproteobacteria bacterium]|nr:intradiol ring-cleavage dioxygenase [Deltaproteobacteria bacterium]